MKHFLFQVFKCRYSGRKVIVIRAGLFGSFMCILLIRWVPVDAQIINAGSNVSSPHVPKPLIDSAAYSNWTHVEGARLTNNGKFAAYIIRNDSMSNEFATVLVDVNSRWTLRLPNVDRVELTGDSKAAVFRDRDTLFVLKLGGGYLEKIPDVAMFVVPSKGNDGFIAFKYKSSDTLILYNIYSGKKEMFSDIKRFFFSQDGSDLVFQRKDLIGENQRLTILDIHSRKTFDIWKGQGLVNVLTDSSGKQGILTVLDENSKEKSVWFYNREKPGLELLVDNKILGIDTSWDLELSEMSTNGKYIYFSTRKSATPLVNLASKNTTLNVWSYLDEKLQSSQMEEGGLSICNFVIDRESHHITRLTKDNDFVMARSQDGSTYVVERASGVGDGSEYNWSSAERKSYYVVSGKDSSNVLLKGDDFRLFYISPEGKYIVYYDRSKSCFISYEVSSGIYRNITKGLDVSWFVHFRADAVRGARGICGWVNNDEWVLIYDEFDVWLVDPQAQKRPVNITNGYGLRHKVIFYLALPGSNDRSFSDKDVLILNALDVRSKQNGFFQKKINATGDPEVLTMGNYIYQLIDNPYVSETGPDPVKAAAASAYLVSRMSATESPNYFFTRDFKKFKQISYVCPEKRYNWYTTQLYTWKKSDGTLSQGLLYKPENFDSLKKYPVIFHYYEKKSFALNEYLTPNSIADGCNIDIPTFVSNGYIVFTPDIEYVAGNPMQGAYDAVVSAANDIAKLDFIDSHRMGIGGCSFGGIETNYLVTHTNIFAAAYSSSSMSDLISAYNYAPDYYETGQGRMGGTLWDKQEMYIRNSPILNADKVTTPLLLMQTTHDSACPFVQALNFYAALRRLGKKVWLLEYTEGDHGIQGKSADDYGVRLSQFFGHYLMGKPAPVWMTRGIPAKLKGIDDGFELDSSILTPGKGLLRDDIKVKQ